MVNLPKNWTPLWGTNTSTKTNTTTTTKKTVDNSDEARLARAKESGNTVLATNLEKKLGIS